MKQEITDYLKGPRLYRDGVALYARYGTNRMLARRFALDESQSNRDILNEELRKLAGLTMSEFAGLPRMAAGSGKSVMTAASDYRCLVLTGHHVPLQPVAPDVQKKLRFRERFPFLSEPDCPDVLKVLVNDMFSALDRYRENHRKLVAAGDGDLMTVESKAVIDDYLFNRIAWRELEHYRSTGQLLGELDKIKEAMSAEDPSTLSDLELQKKIHSARTNLRKAQKASESAGTSEEKDSADMRVASWTDRLYRLKSEMENRKKKY